MLSSSEESSNTPLKHVHKPFVEEIESKEHSHTQDQYSKGQQRKDKALLLFFNVIKI